MSSSMQRLASMFSCKDKEEYTVRNLEGNWSLFTGHQSVSDWITDYPNHHHHLLLLIVLLLGFK